MEWGVANCILFYDRQLYFHGTSKVTPHTLRTCHEEGWTDLGRRFAVATKYFSVAQDTCGSVFGTCFMSPLWRQEF